MMHKKIWKISAALLGFLLSVLTGCVGQASAPTRFYMLKPIVGSEIKLKFAARDRYVIVGIAPIDFPAYLDRPQLIIQKGRNEYRLAEFDNWAEPLRNNFERVFFENLNILLNDLPVAVVGQSGPLNTDYQIRMAVIRMESDQKGRVTLDAGWVILGDDGRKIVLAKMSRYDEQSASEDYVEIVAAQSRSLEALSREVAEAIKNLPPMISNR
jgi:uncharacterized lipoprotein YmbA